MAHSEAKILCYYLDAQDADGKHVWHRWSEEHPLQAEILWPAVTAVAKQQLYLFTPDLLWLAAAEPDADQLKRRAPGLLQRSTACWHSPTSSSVGMRRRWNCTPKL